MSTPIKTKTRSYHSLRSIPLFSELSTSELELVLECSTNQRFGKGSLIFQEGDFGNYLLIILSGRVKVSLVGKEGKEFILAILGPGSFLG
jgi:CRP-like cAMP-binding protein